MASDIALPVVDHNDDIEESHSTPSITTSSSLTEHMFAEMRLMNNMPASAPSEWAPIGNSYTISSGQFNKWHNKNAEGEDMPDDKRKQKSLSNAYRRSKTVRSVLNM